ncbi:MAG: pilus assembly protein N-terminal domain-containing protein, partial [Caulobacteraceae bacterium]
MRVLRPLAAAAAALFMCAAPASARDIRVALDQAFPIRLSEAAEGVAIGNPAIAGVSVQNDMFLFVT